MASIICSTKNYSYQHIQGVMLVKLNKLAYELELSHIEYRIMATLIGLWNINTGMAFPSISELAKQCCISQRTAIRNLANLIAKVLFPRCFCP